MSHSAVTVIVPTLAADQHLESCLRSLAAQTRRDFDVVVVDNSGRGLARANGMQPLCTRIIEQPRNTGFGAAVNAGIRASATPLVATLNDDAVAHPGWLAALLDAMERRPDAGMCASQVRLFGDERLDSCGMLVCRDASSKQRGHLRRPADFPVEEEVLMPSGSAALYRRAMLDEAGLFDEDFFLYCEDTDLGLRARWFGWRCLYVPEAVVEHHYSHSAGRASRLKAYYVERNRLFVLVKNFPGRMLFAAPFVSAARYFWHFVFALVGRGTAARFRQDGNSALHMAGYVIKAHCALLWRLPCLLRRRAAVLGRARVTSRVYTRILSGHAIGARRVAEL